MLFKRREFIKVSFKSVIVIGVGNSVYSYAGTGFLMPGKTKIKLRFAIVSDGHYGQPDTEYLAKHEEMNAWLEAEKTARGLDFIVINGDIFHEDAAMLPLVKKQWDKLSLPCYVTHGNHDKVDEEQWTQTWNSKWHYVFEKGDIAFLVLNTADDLGNYICPDLAWTKAQLEKHQNSKYLFVFMHITPLKWTKYGINCAELVEMFSHQNNLKAIFSGHDHDQDNIKVNNGKPYFFDSHIAGNWGTQYRGYRIVEVMENGSVITYQLNPVAKEKMNQNNISL